MWSSITVYIAILQSSNAQTIDDDLIGNMMGDMYDDMRDDFVDELDDMVILSMYELTEEESTTPSITTTTATTTTTIGKHLIRISTQNKHLIYNIIYITLINLRMGRVVRMGAMHIDMWIWDSNTNSNSSNTRK